MCGRAPLCVLVHPLPTRSTLQGVGDVEERLGRRYETPVVGGASEYPTRPYALTTHFLVKMGEVVP